MTEQEEQERPRIVDKRGPKEELTQEQMEALNVERLDAKRRWILEHVGNVEVGEEFSLEGLQDWAEPTLDSTILYLQSLSNQEGQPSAGPEVRTAYTAFVVIVDFDGSAYATADLSQSIEIETPATPYHMFSAVQHVIRDLQAIETAKHVMRGIQQVSAQAQAMRSAQQTAAGLGLAQPGQRRR